MLTPVYQLTLFPLLPYKRIRKIQPRIKLTIMKTQMSAVNRRPQTFRHPPPPGFPLGVKLAYSCFMAVLLPVYWVNYGPTNFLYFCDVALLLTLPGWSETVC